MYKIYFFTGRQNLNSILFMLSTGMLSVTLVSNSVLDDEATGLCNEFKWLSGSTFFDDDFRSCIDDSCFYVVESFSFRLPELLSIIFTSDQWQELKTSQGYTYVFVVDRDSNDIILERRL